MGFTEIRRIFGGRGVGEMEDRLGNKPAYIEKHLTVANCLYVSGFWSLLPQTPTGALPLDPAGGLPSLRPPPVPTLTSEAGYTTGNSNSNSIDNF